MKDSVCNLPDASTDEKERFLRRITRIEIYYDEYSGVEKLRKILMEELQMFSNSQKANGTVDAELLKIQGFSDLGELRVHVMDIMEYCDMSYDKRADIMKRMSTLKS